MRTLLRTLPIRWQITILHATILALVLAAGGLGLWDAQRRFLYNSAIASQLTEVLALIPTDLNTKLEAGMYPAQKPDFATLKERYAKIAIAILPPGADPVAARKKIALLDPKLADLFFPPGVALPPHDEMEMVVSKLVSELFPPDQDPVETRRRLMSLDPALATALFPTPSVDQAAFQKYLADLVQQASAKDRGVMMIAPDGSPLARNSFGPACALPSYLSKGALTPKPRNDFFNKLRETRYLSQVDQGQLTLLLPVIWQQDGPLALAQICVPTDSIDASLNQLAASLAIGWVLVVGLATALGVTATRRVLRPLDRVVATTGRIAAGDLKQRVGLPPGRTEIAQLGAAFDAMVTRLEASFAAQRRFIADAAHELRTPLTALSASVELLLMGAADDRATAQRLLRHLDSELSRVIRLTNDLLTLSRLDARQQSALRPIDLSALLEEAGEHNRTLLRGQELIVDVAPGLWVQGNADRLQQVVLNLLDNARKHTPPGGRITLRAYADHPFDTAQGRRPPTTDHRPPTADRRGWRMEDRSSSALSKLSSTFNPLSSVVGRQSPVVVVEVEDTGVGIPADALPHLFERFYRVDSARARASGGSGLGLAIVQGIVQAHGGQISLQSSLGQGTCVTIQLPRSPDTSIRSDGTQGCTGLVALPGATKPAAHG
jgi:signal transduction histidine kinase